MYITINQALTFWDELVTAYMGCNTYAGNVAEIYLYSMLEHKPTFAHNPQSTFVDDEVQRAKLAMLELIQRFQKKYDCLVTMGNGDPVVLEGRHRYHLQVTRNESV